jgi:UDP-N-acetylglucosamine 2-epimerase
MDLALSSKVMVGNSSFGIREAAFIGLPVLNLGKRQMGRERALNVLEIITPKSFVSEMNSHINKFFPSSSIYGSGSSGQMAANYLLEWTPRLKLRK